MSAEEPTPIFWCEHKHGTGDKKYPVLCMLNGKRGYYVTQRQCSECHQRRNSDA